MRNYSKKISKCRICLSTKLVSILNLGDQPAANSLKKKQFDKEKSFPLNVIVCEDCKTSQLSCTINPEILFQNYVWVTGTSKSTIDYLQYFYNKSKKYFSSKKNNILEIASNDGSLLKIYKEKGHKILGVDPAKNISSIANKKKLNTECGFFSYKLSKKNKKIAQYNPDLIIARNVIPHVENIHSVVKGISNIASNKTKVLIEFHYAKKIINDLQYDSIYHEHIFYFTIKSLSYLFKKYNFYPFDVFSSPISGGSLVISFSKEKIKKTKSLLKYISSEKQKKINSISTWKKFGLSSIDHAENFNAYLKKYKNPKVIGFGSSARSSTFLNFCKLDNKTIDLILDNNPLKNNKYTAGTDIKIISPNSFNFSNKYKYTFVILAWNFKKEILSYLKNLKLNGFILIPFPKIKKTNL